MKENNPHFTIIMPCFNEERYIQQAVESLVDDWVLQNGELIIVDGGSEDRTKNIIQDLVLDEEKAKEDSPEAKRRKFASSFLKLLGNEKKLQAYGLNEGIKEARGEVILRGDAHCLYPPGYVQRCVSLLDKWEPQGIANVGGYIRPFGETLTQQAIAIALRHPVGVGDARWHLGKKSGFVDTVYLGTFRKNIFKKIGLYDPKAHPNEDAELNLRLLRAGKKIYLDSSLEIIYFVKDSLPRLARQYFHYGRGRCYTTWKHRRFTSWRQIAPVLLVLGLIGSIAGGFFYPLLWFIPGVYILGLSISALVAIRQKEKEQEQEKIQPWPEEPAWQFKVLWKEPRLKEFRGKEKLLLFLHVSAAFAIIHICWGVGFLLKLFQMLFLKKREKLGICR